MKQCWIIGCVIALLAITGCSKDKDLNFFSVSQDVAFGAQLDSTILANPAEFPILNAAEYSQAYAYLQKMLDDILKSDEILHRDEFKWKLTIINSNVVNAFAAPGGYLYFYTGLIKFLDNGSELAGILAHEVAHADKRHSTEAMTKQYGFSILLSILLGEEPSQLEELLASLALQGTILAYSRKNENEADKYAVHYTAYTKYYYPLGVGQFFETMLANSEGGNGVPEFLSTHPSDENRLENVNTVWTELQTGDPSLSSIDWQHLESEHAAIKAGLP